MGRVLVIEFAVSDTPVFDEIMRLLECHPSFESLRLADEPTLSLSRLEIYPQRRKAYLDQQEINLTTKEFNLLCLLVANKGLVLSYGQIFRKVWGEEGLGSESNAVGCHVRNLRKKLYAVTPDPPFSIRCVRDVGYCFEVYESKVKSE